jgi:hypothetical protein
MKRALIPGTGIQDPVCRRCLSARGQANDNAAYRSAESLESQPQALLFNHRRFHYSLTLI